MTSTASSTGRRAVVGEKATRLAALRPDEGFCAVLAHELSRSEMSQVDLAKGFWRNESSLRRWLYVPGGSARQASPDFDELLAVRKGGRLPCSIFLDAAQLLVGPCGVVTPAPTIDLPEGIRPVLVMRKSIEAMRELQELLEETEKRCSDGRVTIDDAAMLALEAGDVRRKLDQLVLMAQRCAAGNRGVTR